MFKHFICLLLLFGCYLASPWFYQYSLAYTPITHAVAVIHPTKDQTVTGVVTFEQIKDGVLVSAHCTGLTPGKHGIHIHTYGACNCPDAVCAGDHFDPTYQPHGSPTDEHQHVGDLGNIEADATGSAKLEIIVPYMTLNGRKSVIGRTVIIHEKEDDLRSQPTGNSGARIGCGVIGIAANK